MDLNLPKTTDGFTDEEYRTYYLTTTAHQPRCEIGNWGINETNRQIMLHASLQHKATKPHKQPNNDTIILDQAAAKEYMGL